MQAVVGTGSVVVGMRASALVVYPIYLLAALMIYGSVATRWLDEAIGFALLTSLLLVYLVYEVVQIRRGCPPGMFWILNPVILASFLTFVLNYGVTNLIYFLPAQWIEAVGVAPEVSRSMNELMWMTCLAAFAMWLGYRSRVARAWGAWLRSWFARPAWRVRDGPRWAVVVGCWALSVLARVWGVQLGVYGYSAEIALLYERAAITQWLALAWSLGQVALAVVSLHYFSARKKRALIFLAGLLFTEVFFGFASGFKSQVLMPFIILALCAVYHRGRFPRWTLVMVVFLLVMAYWVIEPFRMMRYSPGFEAGSLWRIAQQILEAPQEFGQIQPLNRIALHLLARTNLTAVGALGIEYQQTFSRLPPGAPDFLSNLLLAPLYAIVPRILWPSKPFQDIGLWYTWEVLGKDIFTTSTAMGPITYLYFAGGVWFVFGGFFFLGVMQRGLWQAWIVRKSGTAVLFFLLLTPLTLIDSAVDGIVVGLIRTTILVLPFQWVVYRR